MRVGPGGSASYANVIVFSKGTGLFRFIADRPGGELKAAAGRGGVTDLHLDPLFHSRRVRAGMVTTLPPESSFKGKLVWQTTHVWPPSAGAPVRMMGGPEEKAQRAIGIAPKPSAGSALTIRMRIYSFMT